MICTCISACWYYRFCFLPVINYFYNLYFSLFFLHYLSSLQLQTYLLTYSYIFFPYNPHLLINRTPHYPLYSYKLLILEIFLILLALFCYVLFITGLLVSYSLFYIYYCFLSLPVLAAAPDIVASCSPTFLFN